MTEKERNISGALILIIPVFFISALILDKCLHGKTIENKPTVTQSGPWNKLETEPSEILTVNGNNGAAILKIYNNGRIEADPTKIDEAAMEMLKFIGEELRSNGWIEKEKCQMRNASILFRSVGSSGVEWLECPLMDTRGTTQQGAYVRWILLSVIQNPARPKPEISTALGRP